MPAIPLQSEEIWAPPVDLRNLEKKKIKTLPCPVALDFLTFCARNALM